MRSWPTCRTMQGKDLTKDAGAARPATWAAWPSSRTPPPATPSATSQGPHHLPGRSPTPKAPSRLPWSPRPGAMKTSSAAPSARILEEDPALHHSRDPRTHEVLLSGHRHHPRGSRPGPDEEAKFGVDCLLKPPKVPYQETIKTQRPRPPPATRSRPAVMASSPSARFQRGAPAQRHRLRVRRQDLRRLHLPGLPPGGRQGRSGGRRPRRRRRLPASPTSASPCWTARSTPSTARRWPSRWPRLLAFKDCMETAQPTLLEPIMDVEVETSEEFMGDIMGDMNSRRGRVQGMDNMPVAARSSRPLVPMAEMLTYSQTLKSITGGRGSFSYDPRSLRRGPGPPPAEAGGRTRPKPQGTGSD